MCLTQGCIIVNLKLEGVLPIKMARCSQDFFLFSFLWHWSSNLRSKQLPTWQWHPLWDGPLSKMDTNINLVVAFWSPLNWLFIRQTSFLHRHLVPVPNLKRVNWTFICNTSSVMKYGRFRTCSVLHVFTKLSCLIRSGIHYTGWLISKMHNDLSLPVLATFFIKVQS